MLLVVCVAPAVWAQATQPQMPIHTADHRGAIAGTVRQAGGGVVAGLTVKAVNAANGAEFTATTDAQGVYSFPALPVGQYNVSIESGGLVMFRRAAVEVMPDETVPLEITLGQGGEDQSLSEAERRELLQRIARLEQRISDLETTAVLSEPETRVRQIEVFVDPSGNIVDEPGPNVRREVTYQRERVYRSSRSGRARRMRWRKPSGVECSSVSTQRSAPKPPGARGCAALGSLTIVRTRWRQRTCSSRQGSRSTRSSSPTSSASVARRRTPRSPR